MVQSLDEKMLMPWHQHHGIFIIISVLILQSCPSIITHRRRQRQDLWLDTGHWTLASHQTTSQTQQQLIPQQYNYDQAAAVTQAEPAFGKKFSQFFQHQHGRRISPGIPHYQYGSKAHPLYFESPTSRKLCNLA